MNLFIKTYEELTTNELYEIIKARLEVFVLEQNCSYQDLDDIDKKAYHVFYEQDGKILAYLRVYKDDEMGKILLGRVLTISRGTGLGKDLVLEGINVALSEFKTNEIVIKAQSYAKGFYEKVGFLKCSEEFILDGFPHIKMKWKKR